MILAAPAAAHADNLFRLYPEVALSGLYSDNVPLRTTNEQGDFAGTMAAGFFLDYTSAARYASLHYDTFAQLFAHNSQYDRAGEGQYVNATDDENLSPTTKLRIDELFYRDAPGTTAGLIASSQSLPFSSVAFQMLLANDQASFNWFKVRLSHYWGRNWSSDLWVGQETYTLNNKSNNSSYFQTIGTATDYHFSDRFSLGPGCQFYDFILTQPGQPGELASWPFVRLAWQPMQKLAFTGRLGVVVSHVQGTSGQELKPGGEGTLEYSLQRGNVTIHGGQQPALGYSSLGAGRMLRSGAGQVTYAFTQRLTGTAGGGYYEWYGNGPDQQIISWGFGLSDRVSQRLRVYASFVELRRNENSTQAVGNYFVVGFAVSTEAFRWSWQ